MLCSTHTFKHFRRIYSNLSTKIQMMEMRKNTIKTCKMLIGCMVVDIFLGSIAKIPSVYYVECITYFEVDRKRASLPFTVGFLIASVSGPLTGYMEQIIGMKNVILAGCILSTVSVFACCFAEEISTLIILWGVILGIAQTPGAQMIPSLLNHHFPKNKSKTNGLTQSGQCFGSLVLPPILKMCIDSYGLQGSFLMLSALIGHTIPAALLIYFSAYKSKNTSLQEEGKDENLDKMNNDSKQLVSNNDDCKKRTEKVLFSEPQYIMKLSTDEKVLRTKLDGDSNKLQFYLNSDQPDSSIKNQKKDLITEIVPKKSIFSLNKFRVFICPIFITLLIIQAGFSLINTTVYTIIIDAVRDKKVDEKLEVYYLMLLSVSDLAGRLGSGFIIDKEFLSYPWMMMLTSFCLALALLSFLFMMNYIILMLCVITIAIFCGFLRILEISLIHVYVEENKRNLAMASRYFLYAPLSLTISPMIGYFREGKGSYDGIFYTLSAFSFVCGCLVFIIPMITKWKKRSKRDDLTCNLSQLHLEGKSSNEIMVK